MFNRSDSPYGLEFVQTIDPRWLNFISSRENATIFHHPEWISALSESYGYKGFILAAVNTSGELIAGVPFMERRDSYYKKRWISLPFTDHCVPLANNEDSIDLLTRELIVIARERQVSNIEMRWDYPAHPAIMKSSTFVLSKLDLYADPADVAKRIKPKDFRNIDVAYKRGVQVKWGTGKEDLSLFYALHCETRRRLGVPVQPRKFFSRLYNSIIQKGQGFVLLAHRDNKYLAAALFLHAGKTLVYKYSASSKEANRFLAIDPIIWTAICWGCQRGFQWMDFGRTETENLGLRSFKRRWGAKETPLIYCTSPPIQKEPSINKLLPAMRVLIKRSPIWFCRLVGEIFYRYAG